MTLAGYKAGKLIAQSAGIGGLIYAMSLGGDPTMGIVAIGAILVGVEFIEYSIANEGNDGGGSDD